MADWDWDLLSSYAGLLTLATGSIYAGSYGSLTAREQRATRKAAKLLAEEEDEKEELPERLSTQDAYLFPIFGSVVLVGLYLVVKYLGQEWVNWILQYYFTFTGIGSVAKSLVALARWTLGTIRWRQFEKYTVIVLKGPREQASISLRTPSLFLIPLGAIPSILYTFGPATTKKSAVLTDVLALSFGHNAISLLKLDSFKTGGALLSGLFLYDIWWVFGTDVMVKVATSLDIPIKILWAKSLDFDTSRGFTMLGLGDIVVPGLFISLALRYDYHRAAQHPSDKRVSTPYFNAALVAYVLGLFTTMFVMHTFKAAQPALLYLSPACIISFLLTSVVTGDFKQAWAWNDSPEESEAPADVAASKATTGPSPDASALPAAKDGDNGQTASNKS